jgi:ribose transport system substrate-binding protein
MKRATAAAPNPGPDRVSIAGLGPHGERAAPPDRLTISEAEADAARRRRFTVAVVLHTTASDWAKQQLAGIVTTLGRYSAAVIEVVDCAFAIEAQIDALNRLVHEAPDAIISIPIGNTAVAEAHRSVARAGIRLVLMDNAPTGLLPGSDYASVVSADNFGLGQVGAALLSPHVPAGETVGVLAYGVDFFATNEREIAFRKWMAANRPDIALQRTKFASVAEVAEVTAAFLSRTPHLAGLFAVWDEPAMQAVRAMRAASRPLPTTTIDLGNDAAIELARGDLIKGIGAQQPYDQGIAVAAATIISLIGRQPPPWVALPGLAVTPNDVVESYQVVWHAPAPPELVKARRMTARR